MSDTPDNSSVLTQRLAIGRLNAPGVLGRSRLQRTYERFSSPPTTQLTGRLFRQLEAATPATPSAVGRPLARIDRSAQQGATPGVDSDSGAQAASMASQSATGAEVEGGAVGSTMGADSWARRAPGFIQAASAVRGGALVLGSGMARGLGMVQGSGSTQSSPAPVVRTVAGFPQSSNLVARKTVSPQGASPRSASEGNRQASSHEVPGPVAAGLVSKRAGGVENNSGNGVSVATLVARSESAANLSDVQSAPGRSPVGLFASGSQPLMRKADSAAVPAGISSPQTLSATVAKVDATVSAAIAQFPSAQAPSAAAVHPDAGELIVRAGESSGPSVGAFTQPHTPAAPSGLPVVSRMPLASAGSATTASPSLLLRKPTAPAPIVPVTTAARTTIARKETGATPAPGSDSAAYKHAVECAGDSEVDRIAAQVESRLARRLEIERERLGVRQWRQAN
jgi:hypothetical protein